MVKIKRLPSVKVYEVESKGVNNKLLDEILRHRTRLMMLENSVLDRLFEENIDPIVRDARKMLKADDDSVITLEAQHFNREISKNEIDVRDIKEQRELSPVSANALANRLVDRLSQRIRAGGQRLTSSLKQTLVEIAEEEPKIVSELINKTVPKSIRQGITIADTLPTDQIKRIVDGPLGVETFNSRFTDAYKRSLTKVKGVLTRGLVAGDGIPKLSRDMSGVLNKSLKAGAGRLVRTEIQRVANESMVEMAKQNRDIIKFEQWTATLDLSTCPICGNLDQRTWKVGEGRVPPSHPNCRCIRIPITKSWRELGIDADEVPEGDRESMNGLVPGKTTYPQWFAKQPKNFQLTVLGPTRFRLFNSGKLPFKAFATSNRIRTIRELKKMAGESVDRLRLSKKVVSVGKPRGPINPNILDELPASIRRKIENDSNTPLEILLTKKQLDQFNKVKRSVNSKIKRGLIKPPKDADVLPSDLNLPESTPLPPGVTTRHVPNQAHPLIDKDKLPVKNRSVNKSTAIADTVAEHAFETSDFSDRKTAHKKLVKGLKHMFDVPDKKILKLLEDGDWNGLADWNRNIWLDPPLRRAVNKMFNRDDLISDLKIIMEGKKPLEGMGHLLKRQLSELSAIVRRVVQDELKTSLDNMSIRDLRLLYLRVSETARDGLKVVLHEVNHLLGSGSASIERRWFQAPQNLAIEEGLTESIAQDDYYDFVGRLFGYNAAELRGVVPNPTTSYDNYVLRLRVIDRFLDDTSPMRWARVMKRTVDKESLYADLASRINLRLKELGEDTINDRALILSLQKFMLSDVDIDRVSMDSIFSIAREKELLIKRLAGKGRGRRTKLGLPSTFTDKEAQQAVRGMATTVKKGRPKQAVKKKSKFKKGGFSKSGFTNTSLGDFGEAILESLGAKAGTVLTGKKASIQKLTTNGSQVSLRTGRKLQSRQAPIDLVVGEFGVEAKTFSKSVKKVEARLDKTQIFDKTAWLKKNKKKPAMVYMIFDPDTYDVDIYWEDGRLGNLALSNFTYRTTINGRKFAHLLVER